jgi:hypothetical protein
MQMNKNIVGIIIPFLLMLFICSYANAEQMYIWEDEDGNIQYSQTEPEGWEKQKFEQTEGSNQTVIMRGGKKATTGAQLKAEEQDKTSLQSQGSGGKTDKVTGRPTIKRKKG